ncbi:MAG: response regulator [Eubacteriales bacterium]|nr:response regulator [Eubacteriales bacterium]
MIRMVIADDENVIIRGIQKLIDWEKYGIVIVGSYKDGRAALDGIIKEEAQIALLDINMPKMNGVEILKELSKLGIQTKVVFISGFQEFEYARSALTYGAKGYILKPIVRKELLDNIQLCIEDIHRNQEKREPETAVVSEKKLKLLADPEETVYVPALLHIAFRGGSKQERKLIHFSVTSFLDKRLEKDDKGIYFEKDEHQILVFKGMAREELDDYILRLIQEVQEKTRQHIGLIVGREIDSMGEIPRVYQECRERYGCFFFFSEWKKPILYQDQELFYRKVTAEELEEGQRKLIELVISQNEEGWKKQYDWFTHCIAVIAKGKRDDAAFRFCAAIRDAQAKLREMGIEIAPDMKDLLEAGRNTEDFAEMASVYKKYFCDFYHLVSESVEKNDSKSITEVKRYIEEHYAENLTLKVMADYFHMNTYYFSSFFKKNTGINFKEYLNEIRLKHTVSLMVTTDKNIGEIMNEVGFADMRSFTKVFQKKYNETPGKYKKRLAKSSKDIIL